MPYKQEDHEFLNHGIDFDARRIYFGRSLSDINNPDHEDTFSNFSLESVELTCRAIDKMVSMDNRKQIEIHMCSFGGSTYALIRLMDKICSTPCKVKFYGSGIIASCGAYLMAVCDERVLHVNTSILFHHGSQSIQSQDGIDFKIQSEQYARIDNVCYKMLADNSKMDINFWKDICNRDLWLTPEECITLGVADKIELPIKRGQFRKQRSTNKVSDPKEIKKVIKDLYSRTKQNKIPEIKIHNPIDEFDSSLEEVQDNPQ